MEKRYRGETTTLTSTQAAKKVGGTEETACLASAVLALVARQSASLTAPLPSRRLLCHEGGTLACHRRLCCTR